MIVREVTITPVAFRDPPLLNNIGVHQPYALRAVVELRCDDGVTGLGESYGDAGHLALLERAAPAVVGADVFDLNGLRRRVTEAVRGDARTSGGSLRTRPAAVVSPYEVGCLDAAGQAVGRPVCDLLGGAVRDPVPFSAYVFYKWEAHPGGEPDAWGPALDPDGIVAQARRMVAGHGFGSIKLKGGVFPPEEEIEAIRALRAAFPEHPLRIDPNGAWRVDTSIRVAEALAGVVEYLEDPTPGISGMAEVARRAPMPLATNMCVVGFGDLPEAVRRSAVGVVLADHHFWGGPRRAQALADTCATFGLGLSMHSNSHLGISLAAMVHLAAATPHLTYACDTHWPWQEEDVVTGGPRLTGGAAAVPAGPGLGVRLDRDALARLHERYLACGIGRRDDTAYMRAARPDFMPRHAWW